MFTLTTRARPGFDPIRDQYIGWPADFFIADVRLLATHVAPAHFNSIVAPIAAKVLLATTEAFTNAVKHLHEPTSHLIEIAGSITDHTITASIRDYGTWQGEPTRKEQGGFGFVLSAGRR